MCGKKPACGFKMELFISFGIIVLCGQVSSITLSGNGTSGGFTVQENESLQLTCSTSTDVQYVSYIRRLMGLVSKTITSVGYGSSGCGTDPTPPSYFSCSCVSRKQYVCVIRNVTRDMNGHVLLCLRPGGDPNDVSGDQTLVVSIGVTAVSMVFPAVSSVSVIDNSARQFRCVTSAGNPQATVEWYKDNGTPDRADDTRITTGIETDTSASGTLIVTIGKLTLTVQRNDHDLGVYCRANNGGNWLYSSSVVLDVQYEPLNPKVLYKVSEVTSPIRVISGHSMTLSCTSTGNPNPTYTWTYPGGNAHSGSTLTLASVQTTLAGDVMCTAMNTLSPTGGTAVVKSRQTTINLQVLYSPRAPSCTISGTTISTTAILVEGTDRTINCTSSANPPLITYTWSTPRRGQVSGASLSLINVQHTTDQGQYTLTVTNTMDPTGENMETGTSNTMFSVNVQFEPSTPMVSYQGSAIISNLRVISGRSMTLNCSSTGNPSPTYTWTYPGGESHSGPNLTFSTVQTIHAGDVTCTAENTLSPTGEKAVDRARQTTSTLQVLYPPRKPSCTISGTTISTTAILVEGTARTINCTSSANPPLITYTWSTPRRGQVSGASLSLINVQHSADQGQYTLTVTNTMDPTGENMETGTSNTMFSVDVQFGPKVQLREIHAILRDIDLNFQCPFVSGNPSETSFVWTRSVDSRQWNSQIVSISSVKKSDAGMYTCTATNQMTPTGAPGITGSHSGTFYLNVQYESVVSDFHVTQHIGTFNVTQSEYSNVTFTCTVDSNPSSTINIRKEGEIRRSIDNSKQLEYTIANLTCWDAGLYTCDGSNEFNTDTLSMKNLKLLVTCRPRRPPGEVVELTFVARHHEQVTLKYTVFAYPVPSPSQFVWKRCKPTCAHLSNLPGKYEIRTTGLSSNLTILGVDTGDYGVYSISVSNGIGEELVEEIYLKPAGPPDPPTELHVIEESIGETQAILTWIPGFNNGLSQTFHLSYGTLIEFATITKVNISQNEFEESINYTINKLQPEKQYYVELFASNAEGNSMRVNATFTTLVHLVIDPDGPSAAIIGGSIGGVIFAVLIIGGVILGVMKLRKLGSASRQPGHGTENAGCHDVITYETIQMTNDKTVYDALGSASRQTGHGTENVGCHDVSTYETMQTTNDKTVYDALNTGKDCPNTSHVYTSLDDSASIADYENVKKKDPVYNNAEIPSADCI
ncbi:hemicentin-1-like isoform X1 [Mya arenaria]|uniref:hemicentin-1-like isoform X1 n=1 Tax=Mya arenaria TaxID=6604 RepID=UPI0022E4FB8D|nr:hemicentin-1-like isoform X1 [Mya arenaria]